MGFGVAQQFITADHFVIARKDAVFARFTVEDLNAYAKMSPETITRPFASSTSCKKIQHLLPADPVRVPWAGTHGLPPLG